MGGECGCRLRAPYSASPDLLLLIEPFIMLDAVHHILGALLADLRGHYGVGGVARPGPLNEVANDIIHQHSERLTTTVV